MEAFIFIACVCVWEWDWAEGRTCVWRPAEPPRLRGAASRARGLRAFSRDYWGSEAGCAVSFQLPCLSTSLALGGRWGREGFSGGRGSVELITLESEVELAAPSGPAAGGQPWGTVVAGEAVQPWCQALAL